MATLNMGVTGESQYQTATSPRQHRTEFGLYGGTSVIYKMRGYYAAAGQFECWLTTNPAAGPPSNHVLQNIAIAAIIDKNFS